MFTSLKTHTSFHTKKKSCRRCAVNMKWVKIIFFSQTKFGSYYRQIQCITRTKNTLIRSNWHNILTCILEWWTNEGKNTWILCCAVTCRLSTWTWFVVCTICTCTSRSNWSLTNRFYKHEFPFQLSFQFNREWRRCLNNFTLLAPYSRFDCV